MSKKTTEGIRQAAEIRQAEQQLLAAKRLLRARQAQEGLLDFTQLSMPDPNDPDNADRSRYQIARHHRAIAQALEQVEKGNWLRLIITMPPRHGKSELASKRFPAWFVGRDPYRHIICTSYSDDLALEFGREVREIMQSPFYRQVFPACTLRKGNKSADRLQTAEGGVMTFKGAGSGLTGRGADLLLIDDPIKNGDEARSKSFRDKQWDWFADTAMSRLMDHMGRAIIIMTRWNEDDLVGRLTDPNNPFYNYEVAKHWRVLHLPALAEEGDPLGREIGEPLWPERITEEHLHQMRALNPRGFAALYQGRPAPEEGDYFKREWLNTYQPDELPKNLRVYMAGDFAVSTSEERDRTCLIVVGVDQEDNIWVLPSTWWDRQETDVVVDNLVQLFGTEKPLTFWGEKGHISKSIGPFLRKRMMETQTYAAIHEMTPAADKQTRAQAIRARMAMGKVRFPSFAPWWEQARHEMLTFPNGKHDDFVDALAYVGLGLSQLVTPVAPRIIADYPKVGTLAWVKEAAAKEARYRKLQDTGGF